MKKVIVNRRHPDHPWVFSNEVIRAEDASTGAIVRVEERRRLVGTAFYNPHSLIALRIISETGEEFNEDLIRQRIRGAAALRKDQGKSVRLVYSESDGLPGLIVDRYQDILVTQVNCLGMEKYKATVFKVLAEEFSPSGIYEKADAALRGLERLDTEDHAVQGEVPDRVEIDQDGIRFLVDIKGGQKTGFFFDQRANRRMVGELAKGEVLDAFCYTGGFSLYCRQASDVLGLDSSQPALELARQNAELNRRPCRFENGDVPETLRKYVNEKRQFDTIILDPPSFTKSRKKKFDALRGYKEINLRAMRLLRDGGRLFTASCSYHINRYDFLTMLREAAADANCRFYFEREGRPAPDHPVLLGFPESDYLKFFSLVKRPAS
jgi:23S rRNA (cytosine1962-C5)-methyltransferase